MSQKRGVHTEKLFQPFNNMLDVLRPFTRCTFFFLITLLLTINSLLAQNNQLSFKHLDLELSDHGIRAIIEDYKGYMWFGGESGLNRFDGINMNIYLRDPGDSTSLTGNSIITFCETKNKELWIGTSVGLNLYNRNLDEFEQYYFSGESDNNDFNFINQIIEDGDENLWIATNGGLCLLNRENKYYYEFKSSDPQKDSLNRMVNAVFEDKSGRVLCGADNGILLQFEINSERITEYVFDNGDSTNVKEILVTNFIHTKNGLLWATTTNTGLIKIKKIADGHIFYEQVITKDLNSNKLSHLYISGICEYDKNRLLFSTENGGLNVLDYSSGEVENYKKGSPYQKNMIGGNSVWNIYKDTKGYIWLGIYNVGINIIDSRTPNFTSYTNNPYDNKSLTFGAISSFAEDISGNIWISSDGGGLDYWNREQNTFKHFRYNENDPNGLVNDAVLTLLYSNSNELWAGTYTGGISIFQPDKRTRILNTSKGLSSNDVFSIVERRNGKIYIGTYNGGLNVYDPETAIIERYANESFEFSLYRNMQMNVLFVDSKDRL